MKIIDILNKIANGEEVPEKIEINGYIYEYQGDDYLFIDKNNDNHAYWLFSDDYTNKFEWLDVFLKTEVEIIEEKKIPEKLDYCEENTFMFKCKENSYLTREEMILLDSNFKELGNKINFIIDYLKSKGDE